MAHNLQNVILTCDETPSLPDNTQAFIRRSAAIHDIVLRVNAFLDFQSVALMLVDQSENLCVAASFGPLPKIYRGGQRALSLAEMATTDAWYFLPQGAMVAGVKTAGDELMHYNWHPNDLLCIPILVDDMPLTAFLALGKPRGNRVSSKNMQALYGCVRWLIVELENTRLVQQLEEAQSARQRAEAALAAQKRHTGPLSHSTETPSPTAPDAIGDTSDLRNRSNVQSELLQRNRELLSLQAAVAATTGSLDMPFVLETVIWEVSNLLDVEGCNVSEWHSVDNTASIIAKYGQENWWEQGETGENEPLYPLKKQVINDKYAAQATISQPELRRADHDYMVRAGYKTLLLLPMLFQNEVFGVIEVFDRQVERVFSDREISLVQLLANQAATALANARLYHQVKTELAARKKAQEQVMASLHEKEVMLKEIHHRVKNNLQVISSLLFLQARLVEDPAVLHVLQESRSRVQTMAMIHEKLYQSADLTQIDFAEYLRALTRELVSGYRQTNQQVAVHIDGGNVHLDVNTAVPCGLIVNELVANALNHAFPPENASPKGNDGNEIYISLERQEDNIVLTVRDNGIGLPPGVETQKSSSLGMQLITVLTRQLHGTLTIERDAGTAFIISFPV